VKRFVLAESDLAMRHILGQPRLFFLAELRDGNLNVGSNFLLGAIG
jgi:hypothetical protein